MVRDISPERWEAAQRAELANWERTLCVPRNIVAEMADAAALDGFMASVAELQDALDGDAGEVLEVGIGPLGLGWLGLFGRGRPDAQWAIDSLPLLDVHALPDDELADFLSRKRRRYGFTRVGAEEAEFEPGRFTLIVCDNVLDHTRSPGRILARCFEWLRRGGYLVVGVNTFSLLGLLRWRVMRRLHPGRSGFVMHPHSGTHRMWRRAIRRAGFRIVREHGPALWRAVLGSAMRSYFACCKGG